MALLAAVWLGGLLCVAGIATPAGFAVLGPADGGRVAGRILASEAATSLVLGACILVLHRWDARRVLTSVPRARFDFVLALAAGAVFCTVAGYYALQPMMADARAGLGALSFGQLHAVSVAFFAVKLILVALMAGHLVLGAKANPASSG